MRNIAFGYSTACNIKCDHCVAAGDNNTGSKMKLELAQEAIAELALSGVTGISFTAGEPTLYMEDHLKLIELCTKLGIYTRLVTNCSWAPDEKSAEDTIKKLKNAGLTQLRLSYSRWHLRSVNKKNIRNAAQVSLKAGLDYFVSFVTDFSEEDDLYESYLRENNLKFFPEPLIYSGRAKHYLKEPISTDYRDNKCSMNCYLDPDLNMYACCDAGSHFSNTNAFLLGNLKRDGAKALFERYDNNQLFHSIRFLGLSTIASFNGMTAREITSYRKCELCEKLFNDSKRYTTLMESVHELVNYHK